MALVYSNTTDKNGIIQRIEDHCDFNDGDISGNTTRLKKFTAKVNVAQHSIFAEIFEIASSSQPDDINHTDYPIQFFDLVSGQRDYSFTTDEDGNLITDIEKVAVKDASSGIFHEIPSVNQQERKNNNVDITGFIDGRNTQGIPTRYDRTATGIFFDPIPNYDSTQGVKIFIYRESSNFTTADTTKKPGFAPQFHELIPLMVSYEFCRDKKFKNAEQLFRDMNIMREAMKRHYGIKDRDVVRRVVPNRQNNR